MFLLCSSCAQVVSVLYFLQQVKCTLFKHLSTIYNWLAEGPLHLPRSKVGCTLQLLSFHLTLSLWHCFSKSTVVLRETNKVGGTSFKWLNHANSFISHSNLSAGWALLGALLGYPNDDLLCNRDCHLRDSCYSLVPV